MRGALSKEKKVIYDDPMSWNFWEPIDDRDGIMGLTLAENNTIQRDHMVRLGEQNFVGADRWWEWNLEKTSKYM